MELPGGLFLFNFSWLTITFSTVSALVMLLRETKGGTLTSYDAYLVNAYVAPINAMNMAMVPACFCVMARWRANLAPRSRLAWLASMCQNLCR